MVKWIRPCELQTDLEACTEGMTVWVMISDHRWLSKDDSAAPDLQGDGVVDKDGPSLLRSQARKTDKLLAVYLPQHHPHCRPNTTPYSYITLYLVHDTVHV